MGILGRLLRRKKQIPMRIEPALGESAAKGSEKPGYFTEHDNVGTRQSNFDQAIAYWTTRNMRQKFDPFVLYVFKDGGGARKSLLELDCIHEAKDTGELICIEPLVFGYYRTDAGEYEAIIAGQDLRHELWRKAKESFERHEGRRKIDQPPDEHAVPKTEKVERLADKLEFVRKYTKGDSVYEVYKCEDVELAIEFLLTKSVGRQQYYVVVETPNGNWGMDIKGLFKEHLLSWQTDARSAEVEGHALGIADSFSIQMAARGINDNFVVGVKCGNCGHQWVEGLRYKSWTLVQCPKCQKRNKISSHNYEVAFI